MRSSIFVLGTASILLSAPFVHAGIVATENARTDGVTSDFLPANDGTANSSAGVVDVYPDPWSVTPGASIHLKVRSVGSGFSVQVFRVGWYGGMGAREVTPTSGMSGAADPQPYPTPDAKYGLAATGWHDSITLDTTGFVPGLYVARVKQTDGSHKDAATFFTVRDDAASTKQPILFVVGFNTHEAYNAWPGMLRGGKSLYAWNSSPANVSETNADVRQGQAVKVSFQRPFLVGGGTADVFRWEYPMVRWLEKNGWETAYALDRDLDVTPAIWSGRSAVVYAGHDEYWSSQMFTNALAARDTGVNMLFVSGDTISWQVRFEDSYATMVGYKENWPNDPMQKTDPNAVTRGFKTLPSPRPAIQLTGVLSSGQIKTASGEGADFPYADLIVANPSHWIYAGTGLKTGDKIKSVMGYEVDSCSIGTTELDAYRPAGQTLLGTITQPWDGIRKGSPCYYQKALADRNVEVIGLGSMAFTWALDDYALKQGYPTAPTTVDAHAQTMITNVLTRWTSGSPPVYSPPDGGVADVGVDPKPEDPDVDGGTVGDASLDAPTADATGSDVASDVSSDGAPVADGGADTSSGVDATSPGSDTASEPAPAPADDSACSCTQAGADGHERATWGGLGLALGLAAIVARRAGARAS